LTKEKITELELVMNEDEKNKVFVLVETQLKVDRIDVEEGKSKIINMRNVNDQKGGGLMAIYKSREKVNLVKKETNSRDILVFNLELNNKLIKVIVVYFAVRTSRNSQERNKNIQSEIESEIEGNELPLIILGDFNGHIEGIGKQKEDINGKIVKKFINDYRLVLLNIDSKCEGEITWERGDQNSTIDFVLVNSEMYEIVDYMRIDEKGDIFDLSDHKLIEIQLGILDQNRREALKWTEQKYQSTNKEDLRMFREKIDRKLEEVQIGSLDDLGKLIQDTSKNTLEKVYRRRSPQNLENHKKEKPWFTEEIRREIKERRKLNREHRNEINQNLKKQKRVKYEKQKIKVQNIIREEIRKFERKVTLEIKEDKSRKQVWKSIKKLRGEEIKREELRLYNEEGRLLNELEERDDLRKVWSSLYNKHQGDLGAVWNIDEREIYRNRLDEEDKSKLKARSTRFRLNEYYRMEGEEIEINIPIEIREHLDTIFKIENKIKPMTKTEISEEEVKQQIMKMKSGKSPGPNGIKTEVYKELIKSQKCLSEMTKSMNVQIRENLDIPESWKTSKTAMIKKKRKPTAHDLRPIALTDVDYKIFMGVIKDKMEKHIIKINEVRENQSGFTRGRRIEDNLVILNYCVEESFRMKKDLYVAAVDFSKAFDSVDRIRMIEVLKKFKIDSMLIDQIVKIYNGDTTTISIREGLEETFSITCGIRQGCTASAFLFKLITYEIMEELDRKSDGFQNDTFKLTSLFFADDGLIMTNTMEDLVSSLEIMIEKSRYYGLDLNRRKSNVMKFGVRKEERSEIEGISVVEEINYLGVTVVNKRNLFEKYKKQMIEKAFRLSNVAAVVVEKAVCRLLIGKTYWKNVAMPSFLHASNALNWNIKEIQRLQVVENGTLRKIMCARSYTPVSVLRGEVGISLVETRIARNRLRYENYMKYGGNKMMEILLEDMANKRHNWSKLSDKYKEKIDYGMDTRAGEKRLDYINRKCRDFDTRKWKMEMRERSSLEIYRSWKSEIKEVEYLDGSCMSRLWLEARSNTLNLRDRKRFAGENTQCRLCGEQLENLEHFLLDCVELGEVRRKVVQLQRPHEQRRENIIGRFLFEEDDGEEKQRGMMMMYKTRLQKEKEQEEQSA